MKGELKYEKLEAMPLVLHQEVATGIYRSEPVKLLATINNQTFYIKHGDKTYRVYATDMIGAVLEVERAK